MQIPAVLAFVAGATLTLVLQRRIRSRSRRRKDEDCPGFPPGAVNTPQLLAWIDAATQGWLILAPDLSIAYINARAERLLHISRNLLVRGMPPAEVLIGLVPPTADAQVPPRPPMKPRRPSPLPQALEESQPPQQQVALQPQAPPQPLLKAIHSRLKWAN